MRDLIGFAAVSTLLYVAAVLACPVNTTKSIVIAGVVPERVTTSVVGDVATIQTNAATTILVSKRADGIIEIEVKAE